jgi:hypothetical protein
MTIARAIATLLLAAGKLTRKLVFLAGELHQRARAKARRDLRRRDAAHTQAEVDIPVDTHGGNKA